MATEELFLRHIDSLDGCFEVITHPGGAHTSVSTGPFVWNIENADRDAVIGLIATAMADPDRAMPPLRLIGGDDFSASASHDKHLYLGSGAVFIRVCRGTASLLAAAISEARQFHRLQLMNPPGEVQTC